MPLPIAAIIGGGAALAGGLLNRSSQQSTNSKNADLTREMWQKDYERDKEFWNMQNAYNDPSAQMQRLSDAGLNPHLVYGNGAQNQASPVPTHSQAAPRMQAPNLDLNSVAMTALAFRQANANIGRTEAETRSIDANTANREFLNKMNDSAYLSELRDSVTLKNIDLKESNKNKQYGNQMQELLQGFAATNPAGDTVQFGPNELAKAKRADIERTLTEAENAKKLGDQRALENALKEFELRLMKQGIYRGSGDWSKIINGLWYSIFGVPIHQTGQLIK